MPGSVQRRQFRPWGGSGYFWWLSRPAAGPWLIVLCSFLCALLLSQQPGFLAVCSLSVLHSWSSTTIPHRHQMRGELSNLRPGCTIPPQSACPPGPNFGHCSCSRSFCAGFQPCRDIWLLEFAHLQECVCHRQSVLSHAQKPH